MSIYTNNGLANLPSKDTNTSPMYKAKESNNRQEIFSSSKDKTK